MQQLTYSNLIANLSLLKINRKADAVLRSVHYALIQNRLVVELYLLKKKLSETIEYSRALE